MQDIFGEKLHVRQKAVIHCIAITIKDTRPPETIVLLVIVPIQEVEWSIQTRSVSYFLMPWLLASVCQQLWY